MVSDEDINKHSDAVSTLTEEVNQAVRESTPESTRADKGRLIVFQSRWGTYALTWKLWVEEHTGVTMRALGDASFAAMLLEYDGLRKEWLGMGKTTEAPPAKPGGKDKMPAGAGDMADTLVKVAVVGGLLYVIYLATKD